MGWVLNQCKAEKEAGGRRGRAVELLEKPGRDLYRRLNSEPSNHLTAVQILSISLSNSQIYDPSLFALEMELDLPVHSPQTTWKWVFWCGCFKGCLQTRTLDVADPSMPQSICTQT